MSRGPAPASVEALRFFVAGLPITAGSHRAVIHPRTGRAVVLPDADRVRRGRLASWQACVRRAALKAGLTASVPLGRSATGPVTLTLNFYLPRPKTVRRDRPTVPPDLDKIVRGFLDPLSGVLFLDDAQVTDLHAAKRYADAAHPVGVHVEVRFEERPSVATATAAPCIDGNANGDHCTACQRPLAEHRSGA